MNNFLEVHAFLLILLVLNALTPQAPFLPLSWSFFFLCSRHRTPMQSDWRGGGGDGIGQTRWQQYSNPPIICIPLLVQVNTMDCTGDFFFSRTRPLFASDKTLHKQFIRTKSMYFYTIYYYGFFRLVPDNTQSYRSTKSRNSLWDVPRV